jgi:hypothetical protein
MDSPFKITLPTPLEKAKQLKEKFGDKSLDVVREIYNFGSANGLREELLYLNSVESELTFFDLNVFVARMKKLEIIMKFAVNSPWVYVTEINNKKVTEQYASEHGFCIGYRNNYFKFEYEKEMFNLIRKYCNESRL